MSCAPRRVAAFDLGTNTFLALVAEFDERGELRVLDDAFLTPRLGAGLARTGRIDEQAMARAIEALRELAARVRAHDVAADSVRAVGTAVFRRAQNAREFVERARRECGLEIEVVSGEEEGALSYAAALSALRAAGDDPIVTPGERLDVGVIDVGGGSTELAWAGGRRRVSASIGALVLTERYLGARSDGAWPDSEWVALRREVAEAVAGTQAPDPAGVRSIVALGGTAANLAALEHGLARFEPARTEGLRVTCSGAGEWAERLRRVDVARRCEWPVEASRAAILPAGLVCLEAALTAFGGAEGRASGRGLRYGLAWKILRS